MVGVRTDEPELRFAKGSRLDTDPVGVGPLVVAAIKWHSGELLVRFEGIADRDAAAELRGAWLTVDAAPSRRRTTPTSSTTQISSACPSERSSGTEVGTVDDVLHSGQDVLVIKAEDGGDVMVPFVLPLVPEVNVSSGYLVIDPPEGLLDIENLA